MSKVTRRRFIGSAAALGVFSLGLPAVTAGANPDRRNILIFFGDDMHGGMMSCAGNPHLNTPNMAFLAPNGVRFTNAYTAYPICSPSRSAMYSGLMPHQNGVTDNDGEYKRDVLPRVMGNVMYRAGYECHHGGKWHIANRPRDDAEKMAACGIKPHLPAWRSPGMVNDVTRNHEGPEPFLDVIASHAPHEICQFKRHYDDGNLPDEIPPPEECPPLLENFGFGKDVPGTLMQWWKRRTRDYESYPKDVWRQYRWYYCRQVERLDEELGRALDALREGGHLANTVVIFTSDHGDGDASHQCQGKRVLYEKPLWVPLIVSGPMLRARGGACGALVSNGLEIMPTVCDVADAECPDVFPGGSLAPFLRAQHPPWRDFVVSEMSCAQVHGRMVRTPRYNYICYMGGEKQEQLFDMQDNPGEMHNLACDPQLMDVLQEHRRILLNWCRKTDDAQWLSGDWPGVA
jgi:arylsulfatase A-like enzyme